MERASSKFRGSAVSSGVISTFSNSLSFPSLAITAKTLQLFHGLTGNIQQGPAKQKCRACKTASSNHRVQTGVPRLRDRDRAGAAGEIFLFRNCITGMCDTTIGMGLASIFSLNVTEAFLSFEYMGIGTENKMSAH